MVGHQGLNLFLDLPWKGFVSDKLSLENSFCSNSGPWVGLQILD